MVIGSRDVLDPVLLYDLSTFILVCTAQLNYYPPERGWYIHIKNYYEDRTQSIIIDILAQITYALGKRKGYGYGPR